METIISTIIGVLVSVGLFYVTYKQTIGAKQERINNANAEVERTITRLIVRENYFPSELEIQQLIDGFARRNRVNSTDMLTADDFLSAVYTRVASDDLLHADQRSDVLFRITEGKKRQLSSMDDTVQPISKESRKLVSSDVFVTLLTFASALAGTGVLFLGDTRAVLLDQQSKIQLVSIFVASLGVIITFLVFLRYRGNGAPTISRDGRQEALDFEYDVVKALRDLGADFKIEPLGKGYDFELNNRGSRIILEAKAWNDRIPIALQRRVMDKLNSALESSAADEAWLIVKDKDGFAVDSFIDNSRIKIFTLDELKSTFKRMLHT